MSFNNNNNSGPVKKNIFCRYGCRTSIKFDNTQVSTKGIKIPLNLDGTFHDCPNSPFNKAKQLQRINNNDVTRTITCKYCGQQIMFNDKITSVRGRKIPLNIDGSNHNCPNNSFNQALRRNSGETKGSDLQMIIEFYLDPSYININVVKRIGIDKDINSIIVRINHDLIYITIHLDDYFGKTIKPLKKELAGLLLARHVDKQLIINSVITCINSNIDYIKSSQPQQNKDKGQQEVNRLIVKKVLRRKSRN